MASPLNGPDAGAVATRAIILRYIVVTGMASPPRGFMDHWSRAEQDQYTKRAENKRLEILKETGHLKSALTPWEQSYFSASAVTMSLSQQIEAGWRLELFGVLLWTLNAIEKNARYDDMTIRPRLRFFVVIRREVWRGRSALQVCEQEPRLRSKEA
jgi:hypothetical protein